MPEIFVNNEQDAHPVSEETIREIVMTILEDERLPRAGELGITLTDDESIRRLNRQYRNLDSPTDVLSFPQAEGEKMPIHQAPGYEHLLGDVVISVPATLRQAESEGHSFLKELTILLIHGILHLYGYDHGTEEEYEAMNEKEEILFRRIAETHSDLLAS